MRDDHLRAASAERRAKGLRRWCGTSCGWLVKDALGPFPDAAMLGVDGRFSLRNREFESTPLQRRVCKLSVPERRTISESSSRRRLLPFRWRGIKRRRYDSLSEPL